MTDVRGDRPARPPVRPRAQRRGIARRIATATLLVSALWSATSCQPVRAEPGSYQSGTITPDGADRYDIIDRADGFDVAAPRSNGNSNLRLAVVPTSAPSTQDHRACISWNGPSGASIQSGLVLRAELAPDHTRAIMVTNNIVYGARTGFNIHLADTRATPAYRLVGQVTLPEAVGPEPTHQEPLPWRLCARAVDDRVDLKVWPNAKVTEEPGWDDPRYSRTVTVPRDWVYVAQPGFYVGHLAPGAWTVFRDPQARAVDTVRQIVRRVLPTGLVAGLDGPF